MININKLLVFTAFILLFTSISIRDSKAVSSQNKPAASPTGKVVQNQVKTQNQGEDQQLQVETREQEGTESAHINQNMSTVTQKVQELLQLKTTGGIGDQVRVVAREQNQSQVQLQQQVNKLNGKSALAKFFFGSDYKAINEIHKLLDQNRVRIQQLQQLQTQLTNTGDQTLIQAAIQAIEQQNTSLQDMLNSENKNFSLFGWLAKFLSR